jgi:3-phenylpropionate/trans-cinnamate dioxygenase ferredoxin reductase component
MSERAFVIVGASLAGAKAAEALRQHGFEGRVVLIGSEPQRPYLRPPLSKEYLRGDAGLEKVYVHDEAFYDVHAIELRTSTTVERIDPASSEVVLAGGDRLRFDRLLLSTGAQPRRLSIPGAQLGEIYYLRSLTNSERLRDRLRRGGRLVVVGAGWIGSEVAASARQMGLEVTVIDPASVPLEHVLGVEAGAIYRDIHSDHGVKMLPDTRVESFEGAGEVQRVRTVDGRTIECDSVVVGVGATPNTQLAAGSRIAVDNGIITDEFLQTALPGVFAAGDVASARHPLFGQLRVEHWANALHQGPTAARNMLGGSDASDRVLDHPVAYDRIPYFYSDQYDVGMEYSGHATDWDEVVFRGDVKGREFIAFWLKEQRILAGMNVNVWDVTDQIQALIRSRLRVDRDRLADADTPLTELAPDLPPRQAQPAASAAATVTAKTHSGDDRKPLVASATPWPHSRAEAEVEDVVSALREYGVLTHERLVEVCDAAHWSDHGFRRALDKAVSAGLVRRLGDDLYELSEPASPLRTA